MRSRDEAVYLADRIVVMSARPSGKIKAVIYAVACGSVLTLVTIRALPALAPAEPVFAVLQSVLAWITAATALWTTVDYTLELRPRKGA